MVKKQHYMTMDERQQLEVLYNEEHLKVPAIAKIMGFCRQTIYNELKLGMYEHDCGHYTKERYSADRAQDIHKYNQTAKGRPLKIGNDHAYAEYLERKIVKDRFSPAAALASARKENFATSICTNTLYSYIDKNIFLHLTNNDLWEKSKRKPRKYKNVKRVAHPKLPSISQRPDAINERKEPGHWEMDLMAGKAGTKGVLMTLTERVKRGEHIFDLPNKKASTIRAVFDRLEREIPDFKEKFKSITTDNGSEFLEYDKLVESIHGGKRFDVYYCHSYAAWEKGSNENHNRMIRRWFPKGTDFSKVSKEQIEWVQNWMNNYPRKILGWKTPNEMTA